MADDLLPRRVPDAIDRPVVAAERIAARRFDAGRLAIKARRRSSIPLGRKPNVHMSSGVVHPELKDRTISSLSMQATVGYSWTFNRSTISGTN